MVSQGLRKVHPGFIQNGPVQGKMEEEGEEIGVFGIDRQGFATITVNENALSFPVIGSHDRM